MYMYMCYLFVVERRRRFNINDRIKELGMLLPSSERYIILQYLLWIDNLYMYASSFCIYHSYCTGIKFREVFNFADFMGDFLSTKINTLEILTAHVQHVYSMHVHV